MLLLLFLFLLLLLLLLLLLFVLCCCCCYCCCCCFVFVVVVVAVVVVAVVGFSGFFSLYCSHTVLYFNVIIFVERMFGYWKMLMTYMPNVRALTAESFTLSAMNKTHVWLSAKSDEKRRAIVTQAQKDVPTLRKRYKERQVALPSVTTTQTQTLIPMHKHSIVIN